MHKGNGRPIVIYGAGAHGRVVADAAEAAGWCVVGFLDDNPRDVKVGRWPLLDPASRQAMDAFMVIGIGDNGHRRAVSTRDGSMGWRLQSVVHPAAWVSPTARLGRGCFVGAMAVVNTEAELGDGVIVNTGAVVEHHNVIGAYAHIAPNAVLGGQVRIGDDTLVGIGASVLPKLSVGARCVVGAGAAVVKDVDDEHTVIGVPGKAR